jgi:hypothetical protein
MSKGNIFLTKQQQQQRQQQQQQNNAFKHFK